MFGAAERRAFEALLNRLRVVFLLSSPLVLLARGPSVAPFVALIALAALASFGLVWLLLTKRPAVLLRVQLWLRALDCFLVLAVLHPLHGAFRDAYYDVVYLLFVIAAAATHGQRGGFVIAFMAGTAVMASRAVHMAQGTFDLEVRHFTDGVFYTLFFGTVAVAVAYLMRASADIVARREAQWRQEVGRHNARLAQVNQQLEQALAERDRAVQARDDFIAIASHELRNPLTSLHGTIGLWKGRLVGPRSPPSRR